MELAGLEPATSWVRCKIRALRACRGFHGLAFVQAFFRLGPRFSPDFHSSTCMCGLHMGCSRRCRNEQRAHAFATVDDFITREGARRQRRPATGACLSTESSACARRRRSGARCLESRELGRNATELRALADGLSHKRPCLTNRRRTCKAAADPRLRCRRVRSAAEPAAEVTAGNLTRFRRSTAA